MSGCTSAQRQEDYKSYIKYYNMKEPQGLTTQSCRGYGCRIIDTVTISKADWKYITAPLRTKPKTAAIERERLRWVIGRVESKIGAMTGSGADWPGTYLNLGDDQQDCADESTNTTLYLLMLQNHKLLRHHKVGRPAGRLPPHLTAVLIEKETGTPYALDSWFHYKGVRAEIAPLEEWKYGWDPQKEGLRLEDVKDPKRW